MRRFVSVLALSSVTLAELQRFSLARVLLIAPDFAILDRIETALGAERVHDVLDVFGNAGITYVSIARTNGDQPYFENVLELGEGGAWTLHPTKVAIPLPKAS